MSKKGDIPRTTKVDVPRTTKVDTPRTLSENSVDDYLPTWVDAFLVDRRARGSAARTVEFYTVKLRLFTDFCESQAVEGIDQISPTLARKYLLHLEAKGHNPGGRHAAYRTLRAFLLWYENEVEPEGWSNPLKKVRAPKVPSEPIEPVSIETVSQMVKACKSGTFAGDRDAAILFCLLDTGARANEFLAVDLEDVNQARGDILIRQGKGHKPRTVYIGQHSKKALRSYLRHRKDDCPALWVALPRFGSARLGYDGLDAILARRAKDAGAQRPSLHDFRRAFALTMLRNGTDVFTLAKLMGHSSITVLQRYLKQTNQDTEAAHRRSGPVDNSDLL